MIENTEIRNLFEKSVREHEVAGAVVIVRKKGKVVCDIHYGYADIKNKILIKKDTILRLASMTKPIMAIAIMLLEEEGKLSIEDPITKYLPKFADMKVADRSVGFNEYYEADPNNPAMPRVRGEIFKKIGNVPCKRLITIRDILCHSSGMGQGPYSMGFYEKLQKPGQTLDERVNIIAGLPLDFQPGEYTGYSAEVAYEVLGKIIEIVSKMNLDTFVKEKICQPLGITDMAFEMSETQKLRIARLYESTADEMKDVTDTESFWQLISPLENGHYSGSAGLLGTVEGYDKIVQMLASEGEVDKKRFLKAETIRKMRTEGTKKNLEMAPGMVWGLGMAISKEPQKMNRKVGRGTYGWSGAYGTHFYIDTENEITVVLGVNCSNIGGADSKFSKKLERIVYKEFVKKGDK